MSPFKGSLLTPYTPYNYNNNQLPDIKILVVSPSAFAAARRAVLPFPLRPIPAIITPTLMDLINNPEYLVSLSGSSAGAFSNPSI
jgi:hypothetical protein